MAEFGRNPACISSPYTSWAIYWILENCIVRVDKFSNFSCQNSYLFQSYIKIFKSHNFQSCWLLKFSRKTDQVKWLSLCFYIAGKHLHWACTASGTQKCDECHFAFSVRPPFFWVRFFESWHGFHWLGLSEFTVKFDKFVFFLLHYIVHVMTQNMERINNMLQILPVAGGAVGPRRHCRPGSHVRRRPGR